MRKHYPLNSNGAEDAAQLPWKDGVPSTGVEGSYPGQALFTDTEAEILAAIDAAGLARGSDLTQLIQAISRGIWLGQFAGTNAALTATIPNSAVLPALQAGMRVRGIAGSDYSGTGGTLALTGIGAAGTTVSYPIVGADGSGSTSKSWKAGQFLTFDIDAAGNARFSGGLGTASSIGAALLSNVKLTTFSAAQQTALTNNAYATLIFTDASTADFTNGGTSGFTVKTAGLYSIALQGYIFTNVTGQSTNDISELILLNGQQIAAGKAPYTALASGTFTENTYASVIVQLAVSDVVKATAGVSVGPPSYFGNANAANHQLTFTKIF